MSNNFVTDSEWLWWW